MSVLFFEDPTALKRWLSANHDIRDELWVGYYKKASKLPSITWPESVDEALCFGWIDGLRKSIDDKSYKIRFTPRRTTSHWSTVNLERIKVLKREGRLQPAGVRAFENRNEKRLSKAAYEQKNVEFTSDLLKRFRSKRKAWKDFQNRSPSYRKQCTWWVVSAKQEKTRLRRLDTLIKCCGKGEVIPNLRWGIKKKK